MNEILISIVRADVIKPSSAFGQVSPVANQRLPDIRSSCFEMLCSHSVKAKVKSTYMPLGNMYGFLVQNFWIKRKRICMNIGYIFAFELVFPSLKKSIQLTL